MHIAEVVSAAAPALAAALPTSALFGAAARAPAPSPLPPPRKVAYFLLAHLGVSDPFYWLATFVREKLLLVAPVVSGAGGGPIEPQKTA